MSFRCSAVCRSRRREPVDSHETFFRLKVALEALNQASQAYFQLGARGSRLYCPCELFLLAINSQCSRSI